MYLGKWPGAAAASFAEPEVEGVHAPYAGNTAYCYSKRAQVLLVDEWRKEHGETTGIKFVSCHPGWVATPGVEGAFGDKQKWLEPMRTTWEGSEGTCTCACTRGTCACVACATGRYSQRERWQNDLSCDATNMLEHGRPCTRTNSVCSICVHSILSRSYFLIMLTFSLVVCCVTSVSRPGVPSRIRAWCVCGVRAVGDGGNVPIPAAGICWLAATPGQTLESGAFYLDREPQVKHIAGPFMTEGSRTKNSPDEVAELMTFLREASSGGSWSQGKWSPP